jgi:hypothetical protein
MDDRTGILTRTPFFGANHIQFKTETPCFKKQSLGERRYDIFAVESLRVCVFNGGTGGVLFAPGSNGEKSGADHERSDLARSR